MWKPLGAHKYLIGLCLGGGTYGDVFQALDLVTKKRVAVKILKPEELVEMDFIPGDETTLWETHIMCKLDHPNIIKLLDVYVHDNKHHLVFELMETNLNGILYDPRITLSAAESKYFMKMLLQGLAYLHQNSIYHGDLNEDNVLLGPDGELKLADFGLARYCKPKEESRTSQVFASMFSAREQLAAKLLSRGPEADIFNVACIFERFLRGSSPPTNVDLADCSVESLIKVFPEASKDCLDLLQQMFVFDPKYRITAHQALQHRYFTSPPLPTPTYLLAPRKFPR